MPVREATLKQVIDLSRRLSPADKLHLIGILSEALQRDVPAEHLESKPAEKSDQEKEQTQVLADLRASGMLVDPWPEMLAYAAAWDALPESEKQKTIEELRDLKLDVSLSEIVMRAREFRPGWEWVVEV
ncbi:MAG: hypothetical protein ACP5GX_07940 [Anaerolineae bacterium]